MLIMITLIELTLEIEVLLKSKQLQSQEFDRDLNKILQRQKTTTFLALNIPIDNPLRWASAADLMEVSVSTRVGQ